MRHPMRSRRRLYGLLAPAAIFALLAVAASPARAERPRFPEAEKATLAIVPDCTSYEPGAVARLAALVTIERGWHVNAHKPTFEYLIPTVLEVKLRWPGKQVSYPVAKLQKFAFEEQPLAVYEGEVPIVAEIRIPAGVAAGKAPAKVVLSYQSCNESQCLPPVEAEQTVELAVGSSGGSPVPEFGAIAALNRGGKGGTLRPCGIAAAAATGRPGGAAATGGPAARAGGNEAAGRAARAGSTAATRPAEAPGGTTATRTAAAPSGGSKGLALMMLLALGGGLILNFMPCVLPVLSLKVFGMVRSAGEGRREVVRSALATAAGILTSFLALAAVSVAAKAAGAAVGWGVQFQRPGFVAFLALVVTLFCLNLWGLFEIPLPGRLAQLGGASAREGVAGHFASGLFATLMATPCSAPFLGTAIGFALAQRPPAIFAIFTAVGLGMALPYLLLALAPGTARLLPKPGAWMEQVRGIMGFLLAAAAVWLFFVLAAQVGPERLALVQLALLGLALFTWLRHRAVGGVATRRLAGVGMLAAGVAVVALAASGIGGIGDGGGSVSGPGGSTVGGGGVGAGTTASTSGESAGLIAWVPFDRRQAESLAASGKLVFVDVTAKWCFTCKANERWVLETPEVARAFAEHAVVAMKADWTNRDDTIGQYLADHGRYGIPFYALYRPGEEPHVFSELLTKQDVLDALSQAGARRQVAGTPASPS